MLKDWTKFEKVWLLIFTAVNLFLYIKWKDSLLGLTSSLTGMLCVVLVAKGKISNYYFGIIQVSTYAYIAYTYKLYGEATLNAFFYLPIQFIGLYMWNKNRTLESTRGEDVSVKRLNKKGWLLLIIVSFVASLIYAEILRSIGGQQVRIDSVAVVLSIIAQILMLKRYAEQWILWILVNLLSIILWVITLLNNEGADNWTMTVMWTAFLINSIYGYINWIKMSGNREQLPPLQQKTTL